MFERNQFEDYGIIKTVPSEKHFQRERLSLTEAFERIGYPELVAIPWIKQDANVKPQYRIIRASKHDGTLVFSSDLLVDALKNLVYRRSYYKQEPPREGLLPMYTIGTIRRCVVHGMVDLPCGRYPGQRERVTIPVRVEWVDPTVFETANVIQKEG